MKAPRIFLTVLFLVASAHRAPAPIQEVQESPTPAPSVAQTARPKAKPSRKSKAKSETGESPAKSTNSQPAAKQNRFAGKWVGTMPEVPWGNVPTELIIDPSETTMQWQESGKQKGTSPAQVNGNTIQAVFQVGVTETWSLTPLGDGTTARVRLQAFMNDQSAIFHHVSK